MKIEEQVCNLELAKKLKDAGVPQDAYYKWVVPDVAPENACLLMDWEDAEGFTVYSAFGVAELGEHCGIHLGEFRPRYVDETEAEYRAKMLLSIIEKYKK